MTLPCPGYPIGETLNPPAHDGGYCCWACSERYTCSCGANWAEV